jgi:DNA-binding transcriptional ArsR family regulator
MSRARRNAGSSGRSIRHPLQVRILAECNLREVTPKELATREKLPVDLVGKHFRRLEKAGYLHVSRTERARGFLRYYYVADRQEVITDDQFGRLSPQRQRELTNAVLLDFLGSYDAAREAGLLYARRGWHASWRLLLLDSDGWAALKSELARLLEYSFQVQAESRARLRKSCETPIQAVLAIAGFEDPKQRSEVEVVRVWDFLEGCREAWESGALDTRSDSHLSWSPLPLDRQGWDDLMGTLPRLIKRALDLEAESWVRLAASGEEALPTILGLAGFQGVPRGPSAPGAG